MILAIKSLTTSQISFFKGTEVTSNVKWKISCAFRFFFFLFIACNIHLNTLQNLQLTVVGYDLHNYILQLLAY